MKSKKIIAIVAAVLALCALAICLVGCNSKTSTEYDAIKQNKKDNYTYLNENYSQQRQTVFIGDSIIEICNMELFDGETNTIYNRGISGDTSDKLLERLYDNALNISPQTLVVLVGTNDLSRKIKADTILNNISAIIDKSKQASVDKILICSLLPVNKSVNSQMVGLRKNEDIIAINEALKTTCEQKQVTFVDFYYSLVDKDGNLDVQYTYDGLHPNVKGYEIITGALKKVL
ncbi:MAG: hypothetical protein HDT36_03870 [Clostridiales bacterium]|nr:hypothetical protein [Clostridiales bacterium]